MTHFDPTPSAFSLRSRTLFLAACITIGVLVQPTPIRAQEPKATDFPFVIICEFEEIAHAYYFSQLDPDGRATYITPDRQVGVISLDGVAERVDGDRSGTCSEKTLNELRAAGQAFDMPN